MRSLKTLYRICFYLIIILIATSILFPIYWMFITSLKSKSEIYSNPPTFFPNAIEVENYYGPFFVEGFSRFIVNSIIVAIGNMILVLPLAFIAAYGLSRYKIYGSDTLFFWALTCRMAPGAAFILPYYTIFTTLGLLDTHISLILIYGLSNLPFALWLLKSGIDAIPRSIDEAALIDGCSLTQLFTRVMLPLAAPSLAATAIFVFVFSWNEFLFASVLTQSNARTVTTALNYFITHVGIRWGEMAAVSVICIIPTIITLSLLQRYIISGLTLGAVKG